jgi:hypothetical protein
VPGLNCAPSGNCGQQIQTIFNYFLLAVAVIVVALVIRRCMKVGVKQTFAPLAAHLFPRRRHRRQEDRDTGPAGTGIVLWQVRVEMRTHRDTVVLARRLSLNGQLTARRWKSLVAGTDSEDDAQRIADTIHLYTAAYEAIHVEPAIPIHAPATVRRSQRP